MGFIIIFLLIVIISHTYVFWHMWQVIPLSSVWKSVIISCCAMAFSCLFLYLSPAQDKMPMTLARIVYELGTSWLIVLLYLIIIFLVLDICRLFHAIPKSLLHNSLPTCLGIVLVIGLVLFCGNIHYHHKLRHEVNIKSQKVKGRHKLLFISDLHLGYHNPRSEFSRWVDLVNAEKAELILIGGDIIDGNIRPLDEEQTWEEFQKIESPMFACLGNHEYLAGKQKSEEFYKQSGITLLKDKVSNYGNYSIIGRDDRTNKNRSDLQSLVKKANKKKFNILIDHQPYHLEEAENSGIDLQLSGHTHHGQVWPLNWITDCLYECAYGYHQRGNTHYYVSSGIGIWGGKFRIGTCSEYVVININ